MVLLEARSYLQMVVAPPEHIDAQCYQTGGDTLRQDDRPDGISYGHGPILSWPIPRGVA